MALCAVAWLVLSAIGAIPYVVLIDATYLDSFFETVSGFTTTGNTLFTGLATMPGSLVLWRALTQWIGGLGILTMFLVLVSRRRAGIRPIAGAESHKIGSARPVPGMAHTLRILWLVYAGHTAIIALALWLLAGMTLFDGVTHALTTLSTGGFCPHDASIAHYEGSTTVDARVAQYIIIAGMAAGGTSFLVHYRLVRREWSALWDRAETRFWVGLIVGFVVLLALEQHVRHGRLLAPDESLTGAARIESSLRTILFQVLAIITTTGYATEDIAGPYFGAFARQLFLVMMLIGGCVGSTGGGFKVRRILLLAKAFGRELYRLTVPRTARHGVVEDRRVVVDVVIRRVAAMFIAWLALTVVGGLVTALLSGHDGLRRFPACSAP